MPAAPVLPDWEDVTQDEAAMAEPHRREKLEEELARVSVRRKPSFEGEKKGEVKQ